MQLRLWLSPRAVDFRFEVGMQREELRLSVHHSEGKFKPKHRQSEIKEKQGEEEWREGILGQFHPLRRLKGCTAGLAQQQATPQALCRLMFLLLNNY